MGFSDPSNECVLLITGFSNKKWLGSAHICSKALLKLPKWWLLFVQEYVGILMLYRHRYKSSWRKKKHLENYQVVLLVKLLCNLLN